LAELNKPYGAGAHWDALPSGARIAIIACSVGGLVLIAGLITFCCIRSVKKGRLEHEKAEAEWAAQQREANEWQARYQQHRASSYNSSQRSAHSSHDYK
jgi:hypothetical protein